MGAIKILIFTSPPEANVYLVNRLLQRHEVVGMVIESPPPAITLEEKQTRRARMLQRYGRWRTFNKLLLNTFRRRFTAADHARVIRERLFPGGRSVQYERSVPSITVPNINDPACARFIDELAPDLLAVCGTTVIKPEIFTRAPLGAINIHTGITPEYRSADPILWALYDQQPDKVGVTIHRVDKGIDTGAILQQESIPLYRDDNLASIQARCVEYGAELYLRALDDLARQSVRERPHKGLAGKSYLSVDFGMLQYLILQWRLRSLRRRLPPPAAAPLPLESDR